MSASRRVARLVQEGSLYVLLFLLPFSIAAIEIMSPFLLAGWLFERFHPESRRNSVWRLPGMRTLAASFGVFFLACAASILLSDTPSLGVRALFTKWLQYLLFTVVVADLVWTRPAVIGRSLVVLACSAGTVVVEAVGQELLGAGPFRHISMGGYHRMTGPYKNPIDLAAYLAAMIPIVLASLWTYRRLARGLLGLLVLAMVLCLGRTEALGAWLGLVVGLAVLAVGDSILRRVGLAVLAVLAVVGTIFVLHGDQPQGMFSLSDVGRVDRWYMWQAALGMVKDRPFMGHGLNTFMENYLQYWVGGERMPRYAHNCYLQMAAETGLIGLSAFLVMLIGIARQLWQGVRRLTEARRRVLLGYFGGLLAFAVHAGLDTHFYTVRQAALFFVLAGLALGLSGQASPAVPSGRVSQAD